MHTVDWLVLKFTGVIAILNSDLGLLRKSSVVFGLGACNGGDLCLTDFHVMVYVFSVCISKLLWDALLYCLSLLT